jgi:hypothetical protein
MNIEEYLANEEADLNDEQFNEMIAAWRMEEKDRCNIIAMELMAREDPRDELHGRSLQAVLSSPFTY